MYELTVEREFSAAHYLREYDGACARMHGHNYRVQITVGGEQLDDAGMLLDFADLKQLCDAVIDQLDHRCLNEIAPFDEINPTSENLARYLYQSVRGGLPDAVSVQRVTVFESARSSATYNEE